MKIDDMDYSPMESDEVMAHMRRLGLDREKLAHALQCSVQKVRKALGKGKLSGLTGLDAAVLRAFEAPKTKTYAIRHIETGSEPLGTAQGVNAQQAIEAFMFSRGVGIIKYEQWVAEEIEEE